MTGKKQGKSYHDYVFDTDERKFIGDFEGMYSAEDEYGFDSWRQDDLRHLGNRLLFALLEGSHFDRILDIGCGKGAVTQRLRQHGNTIVGLDASETAIRKAAERYPDIDFVVADVFDFLGDDGADYTLVSMLEILSYIEDWRGLVKLVSERANFFLLKLYVPDNPIGYVKSIDDLRSEIEKHYRIESEVIFDRDKLILLARSKSRFVDSSGDGVN